MRVDPELLEAFLPEFRAACAALAGAEDEAQAARFIAQLSAMAAALAAPTVRAGVEDAALLLDPFERALLPEAAAMLLARAEALAGPAPAEAPPTDPGQAAPNRPDLPSTASAAPRIRTLVVDDSALMRRLLRETLEADPLFEIVGEAADGLEALRRMADLAPNLTVLDIEMPELDGLGVLRVWALTGTGAMIIASSSARPASAIAIEARRLGASAIVGKPSGAYSPDLRDRQGDAILRAARRAVNLPAKTP